MLAIGRCSSVSWSIGGERTGSISVVAQMSDVRLLYTVTDCEGANEGDELVDTRLYVDALRRPAAVVSCASSVTAVANRQGLDQSQNTEIQRCEIVSVAACAQQRVETTERTVRSNDVSQGPDPSFVCFRASWPVDCCMRSRK